VDAKNVLSWLWRHAPKEHFSGAMLVSALALVFGYLPTLTYLFPSTFAAPRPSCLHNGGNGSLANGTVVRARARTTFGERGSTMSPRSCRRSSSRSGDGARGVAPPSPCSRQRWWPGAELPRERGRAVRSVGGWG
jgi:hypothetical protein